MRIGVNATCINDRPSGARQRFVGLFTELIRQRPDDEFVIFEPADCRVASWFEGMPNVVGRRTPLHSERRAKRLLAGMNYWPKAFAAERFDVFEAMHLPIVKAPDGRTILTIHDVRGLHPGTGLPGRLLYRRILKRSLQLADQVVTVSETMRQEILAFSPGTPVCVIHNGIDAAGFATDDNQQLETIGKQLALHARFLLAVGHFEPRKNYPALVDAMALLHAWDADLGLVIVGNDSGEMRRVVDQVQRRGLESCVRIFSGVSDEQLRCLYRLCSAVVFPSTYEGFGIPVLEAMAARKPLVISDIPVFREIAQDHAAWFDPSSAESIAGRIREVLASDPDRQRMVESGSDRLKDFSFSALAGRMSELYDSLAARKSGV